MAETTAGRNSGEQWTDKDVAKLRELADGNTPTGVMRIKLGRSEDAIRTKAKAREDAGDTPDHSAAADLVRPALHQDLEPWLGHPLGAVLVRVAAGVVGFLLAAVHLIRALHVALATGPRCRLALVPDRRVAARPLRYGSQPFL